jgi:hypothetical protein
MVLSQAPLGRSRDERAAGYQLLPATDGKAHGAVGEWRLVLECQSLTRADRVQKFRARNGPTGFGPHSLQHFIQQHDARQQRRAGEMTLEGRMVRWYV